MIIKFKLYESINKDEPKNGDWVICKDQTNIRQTINDFLSTNIGRIKYTDSIPEGKEYNVEFFCEIPVDIRFWFFNRVLLFYREDILHWSKNKEDLELLLQSNKYNL